MVETDADFLQNVMVCCARIIALCDNSDLCFVGRSPENLFDLLSGLFLDSHWSRRIQLLQLSWRGIEDDQIAPRALAALRSYLEISRLDPWHLARKEHPVAFVDLIYSGETLGNLLSFLSRWARELGEDWERIKRHIRIVGITARTRKGPKTWRWQQHAEWVTLLQRRAIKNVSISPHLWYYLGEEQAKVTRRYGYEQWGNQEAVLPQYEGERLKALRLAAWLFEQGCTKEQRRAFARCLGQERAMIFPWFRELVLELKGLKPPDSFSADVPALLKKLALPIHLKETAFLVEWRSATPVAPRNNSGEQRVRA
jgi:hypothetical protein